MENSNVTIKEFLSSPKQRLFTVDFFGDDFTVTVTSTPSVVRKWISSTLFFNRRNYSRLVVGLGVQWNPSTAASEPAATLQLCVGRRCLVLQLAQAGSVPNSLRRFLNEPNFTFVGIWNHSDADRLLRSDHELKMCCAPLDLRYTAADKYDDEGLVSAPMETLVSTVLGHEGVAKDYNVGRSNWDAHRLTHDQVLYAAVDAYVSSHMGKEMSVWCSVSSDSDCSLASCY